MGVWNFIKFLIKFLIFSLVWTYGGRFLGTIYLIAWASFEIASRVGGKKFRPLNFSWKDKDKRLYNSFPEYY